MEEQSFWLVESGSGSEYFDSLEVAISYMRGILKSGRSSVILTETEMSMKEYHELTDIQETGLAMQTK